MPRRNRNVPTVPYGALPDLARAVQGWDGLGHRTVPVKPSAKRRRIRFYGGEL